MGRRSARARSGLLSRWSSRAGRRGRPSDEKAAVDARIAALQAEHRAVQGAGGRSDVAALGGRRGARGRAVGGRRRGGARIVARGGACRRRAAGSTSSRRCSRRRRAARAPSGRVREGGCDPRGAGAGRVHRRAAGHARVPRLGGELRRRDRQRRVARAHRPPGQAHRASGRAGERADGGRAARDDRDEALAGRDGLGDLRAHRRGARRARRARRGARPPRGGRVAEAERARGHAGDACGVPRRGRALAAQSAALAEQIRGAQGGAGTTGDGPPSAAGLIWPCDGVVVSGFGMRWGGCTRGSTSGARTARPNRAAAAGTVIHAGWLGGYGNLVVVDHGNGLSTAYAHASAILVGVGQTVARARRCRSSARPGTRPGRTCTSRFASTASPSTRCSYL